MSKVRRRCAALRAGRVIELSEIDDSACAGESGGNDRLTLLAHLEGDDEGWSAQLHAAPRLRESAPRRINMCSWGFAEVIRAARWQLGSSIAVVKRNEVDLSHVATTILVVLK